ncbi:MULTISPECIES: D-hexose-6-phosphate mutarotase [Marinobacter]|jgi:glucose-6-phosphate 1-epimerase|uniref:D-hexose-6-phosphate mutarotase n=2 Tax=Marinobacteraceae TaxID=2887365 RepID=UPI0011082EBB|nr:MULTISPECIES: D-hexose-6-phosphate mutarotase [Marinobacter]MCK2147756.1 D-hexose-6-phosphate mutarotase [Marinobacter alexandrii]
MSESSNRPPLSLSPGQWSFTRWRTIGQLEALDVNHPLFRATVFLQGAHLTHFAPKDEPDWLWCSDTARMEPGRAIRGGVPVCWPWFGDPAKNAPEVRKRIHTDKAHGFARTSIWKLEDVRENAHEVEISLSLDANEDFHDIWSGHALALITFSFSIRGCQVALTTTNMSSHPLAFSQALHSYFPTPDVGRSRVLGLGDSHYIDTLRDWEYCWQEGPVYFEGETDRIYESGAPMTIVTPAGKRKLSSVGSDSTVVWNPGPAKAATLSDFRDEAWKNMLCVETANASGDYRVLNEGQSHTLGVLIGRA